VPHYTALYSSKLMLLRQSFTQPNVCMLNMLFKQQKAIQRHTSVT